MMATFGLAALALTACVYAKPTAVSEGQMTLAGQPFFPWGKTQCEREHL